MPDVRLQKALAEAGVGSRRYAEGLIAAGRVSVEGSPARLGIRVDPARQSILVDGQPLAPRPATVWLALHKPRGVTSTVWDPHAASTVLDLVPREVLAGAGRLYPVGRLDRDSEGLLLITNDGEWAQRVLHPGREVDREYAVGVRRPLSQEQGDRLLLGVELEEGRAYLLDLRPAGELETQALLRLLEADPPEPLVWYLATLGQGWKRQVRRMFAAVGAPVARLVRVRVGGLRLGALRSGEIRRLSDGEAARAARGRSSAGASPQAAARARHPGARGPRRGGAPREPGG
ncbi:MAG: pseudouridine synthase [Candidatus Limnocylindrales bacterium]